MYLTVHILIATATETMIAIQVTKEEAPLTGMIVRIALVSLISIQILAPSLRIAFIYVAIFQINLIQLTLRHVVNN